MKDRTKSGPTRSRREAEAARKIGEPTHYSLVILGALQSKPVFAGTANTRKRRH